MFLISKGGKLDILNDQNQSPIAVGPPTLLNLLNLREVKENKEKTGKKHHLKLIISK